MHCKKAVVRLLIENGAAGVGGYSKSRPTLEVPTPRRRPGQNPQVSSPIPPSRKVTYHLKGYRGEKNPEEKLVERLFTDWKLFCDIAL